MLQLLVNLGVNVVTELGQKLVEMEANGVHNLTLVDDRVQRVPHLMGDR